MTSSYYGVVRNQVVVLPDDVEITDGTVVEIRVITTAGPADERLSPDSSLAERLVASGLMREVKPPLAKVPEGDRTPIRVAGEPLSETIIRDRR